MNEILLKLYCNTANTSLHLNRPYVAMHYCNKALQLDKDNVKALFHYGKAKIDVGDYDQAIRYLMRARSIKSNNTDISHELARVNRRRDGGPALLPPVGEPHGSDVRQRSGQQRR